LAAFFCYRAVAAHLEAQRAQAYADSWYQQDLADDRAGIPKGTFSVDPKEQMHESYAWKQEAIERRDSSTLLATVLLFLPIAAKIGIHCANWIWGVGSNPNSNQRPNDIEFQADSRHYIKKVGKIVVFTIPAIAGAATLSVISPQKMVTVIVSTLTQAIGVVLLVWLIRNIRR
jgi:hypothetical protein